MTAYRRSYRPPRRRTDPRRPSPYVPHFRMDGHLVPAVMIKKMVWTADKGKALRQIEKYFVEEFKSGHRGCAALRRMPTEEWNALMDLLPRCFCGRMVSPRRAMTIRQPDMAAYCSDRCQMNASLRGYSRRLHLKSQERKREAQAIADALYQIG